MVIHWQTSEKRPPLNSEQRTLALVPKRFCNVFYLQIADASETSLVPSLAVSNSLALRDYLIPRFRQPHAQLMPFDPEILGCS